MSNVSAALSAALDDLGWSQTELAQKADINLGMLNRYVRGTGVLGEDNLQRLLSVLPEPQNRMLLAGYLRDLIPPGKEQLVSILTNSILREEAPILPEGLEPELADALGFLARKAQIHTEVKDMLVGFTKLIRGS
jgi:transcriptional regulator with XRE-family HTH domain